MKKLLIVLLAILALIGVGGYTWYRSAYGGTNYYVKITEDGKKSVETASDGTKISFWNYELNGVDKSGKTKSLKFSGDHNLKRGAYLNLTYNEKKGVTSWEEVQKAKVPEKALEQINK